MSSPRGNGNATRFQDQVQRLKENAYKMWANVERIIRNEPEQMEGSSNLKVISHDLH
jgi:hypothetical protein